MIEIARNKLEYAYRINPYVPNHIDRRENKRGARWFTHSRYGTAGEAVAALLKLGKPAAKDEAK
jgi:hypothetical protein